MKWKAFFANPLEELIEFGDMNRELERGQGPLLVSGCMDSQKAHLMSELTKEIPWKLIVTMMIREPGSFTRITGVFLPMYIYIRPGSAVLQL